MVRDSQLIASKHIEKEKPETCLKSHLSFMMDITIKPIYSPHIGTSQ